MNVFAIDPGTTDSAFVVWDTAAERLLDKGKWPNERLLLALDNAAEFLIPNVLAVEMIASYGMPVGREVFETCVWVGRFWERWQQRQGGPYYPIYRKTVCSHICHDARAKDPNIRAAIIDRLGAPGTKKHPGKLYGVSTDIWSALGVAITCADMLAEGVAV